MRLSAIVVAAVLAVPAVALAQPAAAEAPTHTRSGGTATVLALGATAAGFGLIAAGEAHGEPTRGADAWLTGAGYALTVVGPSAGHIYAGEGGHALGFSALRAASMVAVVYGATQVMPCLTEGCPEAHPERGAAFLILGDAAYLGLTIYDVYDAHRAVRRASAPAVVIAPSALRTPGGRTATGLVVAGRF